MIEYINIRNIATYNETGIQISDLKKVNFIYGANASGKTTISNFLYKPDELEFESCSFKWKNDIPLEILVYNKGFRDRNLGKGTIDGVFTLGQATKEQEEEIERKRKELNNLKEEGIKKKNTLDKQTDKKTTLANEFKENTWFSVYKKYETTFKEAFKGVMQKESFKNRIINEFQSNSSELKSFEELTNLASIIFGNIPKSLTLFPEIDFQRLLEIENDKIWNKKIVGKSDVDIAKLIRKLNLNDWVNEGRNYIQDNEVCPFCQQETITPNFKKQIEDYFDETFIKDTDIVKGYKEEYNRLAENLINELTAIESAEKANEVTKLDIEKFSAHIKTLTSEFISNKEFLNNKSKEPSRAVELISVKDQLENIALIINSANDQIKKHNKIVLNYTTERAKLINEIWRFITVENKVNIERFIKHHLGLQKGINAITKIIEDLRLKNRNLDKEIIELAKNITSIQPSVDEINRILDLFDFQNFKIVPSKTGVNQYQIQREDGSLAESTLSEGEITFITFLYYMQLAKGSTKEENITNERILVVDDPISSLDSNVLFVVGTLIKEIVKSIKNDEGNIKQLILLTHNVYFHKEVSFIDGRTKENGETHFWILRKNNNITSIQPFEQKNPIQNSYELLWQELKNSEHSSGLTIQNIMRRIIENYFKILGKYGDDDLIKKFKNPQEQEICRSLISWVNEGSHGIPDDLFVEHQDNTIEKYNQVFKNIFKETGHIEHYNMMMK